MASAYAESAAPVAPSLSVLRLRVTPRGKHLHTADLAKPSNSDIIHVISDKRRQAAEAAQGDLSDDSDEGGRPARAEESLAPGVGSVAC